MRFAGQVTVGGVSSDDRNGLVEVGWFPQLSVAVQVRLMERSCGTYARCLRFAECNGCVWEAAMNVWPVFTPQFVAAKNTRRGKVGILVAIAGEIKRGAYRIATVFRYANIGGTHAVGRAIGSDATPS